MHRSRGSSVQRRCDASDDALLVRARQGDLGALGLLYDRHATVAYGLAIRVLGEAHLAESAVEDAFAALLREGSERGARVHARLFALVHRFAIELRPPRAPGVSVSRHDRLLSLAYYDGYTVDEIASHLHLSRDEVNARLRVCLDEKPSLGSVDARPGRSYLRDVSDVVERR